LTQIILIFKHCCSGPKSSQLTSFPIHTHCVTNRKYPIVFSNSLTMDFNMTEVTEPGATLNATLPALGTQPFILLRHPAVLITDWIAFIILFAWSIILAHRIASFKVDDSSDNYFFGCPLKLMSLLLLRLLIICIPRF
jgi:hypothetical protein